MYRFSSVLPARQFYMFIVLMENFPLFGQLAVVKAGSNKKTLNA